LLYHEALKKKHNRNSQYSKIYNNIANIYLQAGDCSRAVEYWQKSHEVSHSFYIPRYRLAQALTRCSRLDDALSHLDQVIAQKPDFSKALNLKGVIRLIQNQPREALALFRQALKLEPANAHYQLNIGAGFYLLGDYQKAKLFLVGALRGTQRERITLLWNAKNFLAMGKPSAADSLLGELVAKLPLDELSLWLEMGSKARIYKSEIIFPAADETLGDLLAAKYRQRLPELVRMSDPQPDGNKLAQDLGKAP
jgi:tetratricopeptide (TPR) repeat protein